MTDLRSASFSQSLSRRFSSLKRRFFRPHTTVPVTPRATLESLENRTHLSVTTQNGWTIVSPAGDSRVIHVSSSSGNDANPGSSSAPVATLARGISLLRSGSADQLLLKRGDQFDESFGMWSKSGRSADEPMLIGAYGNGARPEVRTGARNGLVTGRTPVNNLVIQSIHLNAHTRDAEGGTFVSAAGGSYGIQSLAPVSNLLIEDTEIENYRYNVSIQKYYGPISNVEFNRNVIHHAYSEPGGGHSQGMYVYGVDGLTLNENVFDNNGWSAKVPAAKATIFNHNAYLKENNNDVVVTNNIFANAASHGLQARAGGTIIGNLFVNNAVHMSFGLTNGSAGRPGGVTGEVSGNVFLGGRDISGSARGWAIELGNTSPRGTTIVKDNVIAHDTQGHFPAIVLSYGQNLVNPSEVVGLNNLTIQNNIVYKWYESLGTSSGLQNGGSGVQGYVNVDFVDNQFQYSGNTRLIYHGQPYNGAVESWSGNQYYTPKSPTGWFTVNGARLSFNSWRSQVDGSAEDQPIDYDDPNRNPGTYQADLGGVGTVNGFLSEARKQSQSNWRDQYTTTAVVNYVRQGFGLAGSVPVTRPRVRMVASDLGPGDSEQILTVMYSSPNGGVKLDSIDAGDLAVTGPGKKALSLGLVSKTAAADGRVIGKYRVNPPGGSWDEADDGSYTVALKGGQVIQGDGTPFPAQSLGGFTVAFGAPPTPPPPGGTPPPGGVFPPGTAPGKPKPVSTVPGLTDDNPAGAADSEPEPPPADGEPNPDQDTDGDGLPDVWEDENGLDSANPDSDNNGILDADEDPDNDGLDNSGELDSENDPNNPDTDNDGVNDSEEDPDNDGLDNGGEDDAVTDPLNPDTDGNGISDADEDPDGDALNNGGESDSGNDPLNPDTDGDGILDSDEDPDNDGLGNGGEEDSGNNPLNPDTNGNGILDGDEDVDGDGLNNSGEEDSGTNPIEADTDGDGILDAEEDSDSDGISNGDEVDVGTNPGVSDTDADGIADGDEADTGSNPLNPDTDGDGTNDGDEDSDGDGLGNGGESAAGTDPNNADTDADGVNDSDEDADGDGLDNGTEEDLGTDPLLNDTDGDGLTDAQETVDGSDPLDPNDPRTTTGVGVGGGQTGIAPIGPEAPAGSVGDQRSPVVRKADFIAGVGPDRLEMRFSEDVGATLSVQDLVIKNLKTNELISAASMSMGYDAGERVATYTFPGLSDGQFAPGRYAVILRAAGVTDVRGNSLDGDGNGVGGDDFFLTFERA